jgi:hypothetical protein
MAAISGVVGSAVAGLPATATSVSAPEASSMAVGASASVNDRGVVSRRSLGWQAGDDLGGGGQRVRGRGRPEAPPLN